MLEKRLLPPLLRKVLTAPLGWCFLASLLLHGGLGYVLRELDPLPEPVGVLPPPIEVSFTQSWRVADNPPPAPAVVPRPSLNLGAPIPPPPPVGNLPPSANLPTLPPPPNFAPPLKPVAKPQPQTKPAPREVEPTPIPLPPPVDTPTLTSEPFDPTNTSTSDGLGNLSRWIASLQPELTRSPKLLRLTANLPIPGCPWAQSGPAVLGVAVNPQGQIQGHPELLRSAGYATLNQKARRLVTDHAFAEQAAETIQAVMVEVTWENVCPGAS